MVCVEFDWLYKRARRFSVVWTRQEVGSYKRKAGEEVYF